MAGGNPWSQERVQGCQRGAPVVVIVSEAMTLGEIGDVLETFPSSSPCMTSLGNPCGGCVTVKKYWWLRNHTFSTVHINIPIASSDSDYLRRLDERRKLRAQPASDLGLHAGGSGGHASEDGRGFGVAHASAFFIFHSRLPGCGMASYTMKLFISTTHGEH